MNERMINQIAAKFITFGIPFEELKAEATTLWLEAETRYQPGPGKLETYCWKATYENLKVYVSKETKWKGQKQQVEIDPPAKEQGIDAFVLTNSMSREAKMICRAIFNAPTEYTTMMPKMARGKIVNKCREEFGWSWPKIWAAMQEIKGVM